MQYVWMEIFLKTQKEKMRFQNACVWTGPKLTGKGMKTNSVLFGRELNQMQYQKITTHLKGLL